MLNILDLIFPIHCYICDEIVASEGLCPSCWKKIEFLTPSRCDCCGFPFQGNIKGLCGKCIKEKPPIDKLCACIKYNSKSTGLMMKFKNFAQSEILDFFMPLIAREMDGVGIDCVVPVPLHWTRQLWRGYNQAAIIAKKVAEELYKPYLPYGLKRIRFTKPNVQKRDERKSKVARAFLATENFKGQRILLVDDVYTTGATMRECAKMLKKAGAESVIALVLCKN